MWLQQSDRIQYEGGCDETCINFEPMYKVTLLAREDWTTGTGTPHIVKRDVWFTDESRKEGGLGPGSTGNLATEGSVSSLDNMPQFFRPKCLLF